MSSQKIFANKKSFCKVCQDAGKSEKEYTSHFVRSEPGPRGKIVCPTLLAQECKHCLKKGHTFSYCKEVNKLAAKEKYIQNQIPNKIQKKPEIKRNVFEYLLEEKEEVKKEEFPPLNATPKSTATIANNKKRSYACIAKTAHEEAVQEEIIAEYIEKLQPKEIVKPTIVVKPIIQAKPKSWAEYESEDEDEEEEELISAAEYYKEYQERLMKPVVDAW